jgi:hypothetical protein
LIIYTITAFRKHFFWPSWPENVFISASHWRKHWVEIWVLDLWGKPIFFATSRSKSLGN